MNPVSYRSFESFGFSRTALLLIFSSLPWMSFAQSTGSLSGKVVDAKTKEPVPFASVFLANTMIGVTAKRMERIACETYRQENTILPFPV